MKIDHIRELGKRISGVNCVTFTGGEPSLQPKLIKKLMRELSDWVDVENFYVATNGTKIKEAFIDAMDYCFVRCRDNEISVVHYSNIPGRPLDYEGIEHMEMRLSMFSADAVHPKYTSIGGRRVNPMEYMRREGNAAINGYGWREVDHEKFMVSFDPYEKMWFINEGVLYLNVNGMLIAGCDWSYETQNRRGVQICKVDEFSFKKLVQRARSNRTNFQIEFEKQEG